MVVGKEKVIEKWVRKHKGEILKGVTGEELKEAALVRRPAKISAGPIHT